MLTVKQALRAASRISDGCGSRSSLNSVSSGSCTAAPPMGSRSRLWWHCLSWTVATARQRSVRAWAEGGTFKRPRSNPYELSANSILPFAESSIGPVTSSSSLQCFTDVQGEARWGTWLAQTLSRGRGRAGLQSRRHSANWGRSAPRRIRAEAAVPPSTLLRRGQEPLSLVAAALSRRASCQRSVCSDRIRASSTSTPR